MASSKDIFEAHFWRAGMFAAGMFRGVGLPAPGVSGRWNAGMAYLPGVVAGQGYLPGFGAGQVYLPGVAAGQNEREAN